MKASVLCDVHRLEVRDIPRPVISAYEVLIRVAQSGFAALTFTSSRSRKLQHQRVRPTDPLALQPQILGHEITGVVEQAGSAVRDLREGDRVVIDQGLNCVSRRRGAL
jgi:threonine dehydrogenase-like Zn-dependent dehydrogenase